MKPLLDGKEVESEKLKQIEKEAKQLDKQLSHPPTRLWCLGCGTLINDRFTGGMWSYTHSCMWKPNSKQDSMCTAFTTEKGFMMNCSIALGNLSFKNCKECKTEEEHIRRTLESYLGKHYLKFKIKNRFVLKQRWEFIKFIKCKIKADSVMPIHKLYEKAGLLKKARK